MGATICPTITTDDPHIYREQLERVQDFARRIHIDLADGVLAPNKLIAPNRVWWPDGQIADIHVMFKNPGSILDDLLRLRPSLVILHAEADGNFKELADKIHASNCRVGLALLQPTPVADILAVLDEVDHVLIFSGSLGHFGGQADLKLLDKVASIKAQNPTIEIGWDGGISSENVLALVRGGVDVLNTGGFIQKAPDPAAAYATLQGIIEKQI